MLASVRDRKGETLYCRFRDAYCRYWDFAVSAWASNEGATTKMALTEYMDSDPYESRYQSLVDVPSGALVAEYVRPDGSVIATEDPTIPSTQGDISTIKTAVGDIASIKSTVTASQDDITSIKNTLSVVSDILTTPSVPLGCGRLTARMMAQVRNSNQFRITESAEFTEGDQGYVYFQLADATTDQNANPPYRRYVPGAGASLVVTFQSVDSAKTVTRPAELAFPTDDRSIWRVQVQASDALAGSKDMKLTLVEGDRTTYGYVSRALSITADDSSL